MQYEIRYIERIVKVYRVEADSQEDALERYNDYGELVETFPIDIEGPFLEGDWVQFPDAFQETKVAKAPSEQSSVGAKKSYTKPTLTTHGTLTDITEAVERHGDRDGATGQHHRTRA